MPFRASASLMDQHWLQQVSSLSAVSFANTLIGKLVLFNVEFIGVFYSVLYFSAAVGKGLEGDDEVVGGFGYALFFEGFGFLDAFLALIILYFLSLKPFFETAVKGDLSQINLNINEGIVGRRFDETFGALNGGLALTNKQFINYWLIVSEVVGVGCFRTFGLNRFDSLSFGFLLKQVDEVDEKLMRVMLFRWCEPAFEETS